MFFSKKVIEEADVTNKLGYNPFLIERIQPQGGISFKGSDYIRTGTGYETCLHIVDFPGYLDIHWMSKICNIAGVITTIDIGTEDMNKVKININKSIKEQNTRFRTSKQGGDLMDASQRYTELVQTYKEISNLGEVIKLLHIRIFISSPTLDGLEKRSAEIMRTLDEFKGSVFLNEQKQEWMSLFLPYSEQQKLDNARYGQPLVSEAVAAGNPFHFSSLNDPTGDYLGSTPCGGTINFYLFTRTKIRTSYNAVVLGSMGSGKSTLLKKLGESSFLRGDFVRTFDPSNEWTYMVDKCGGKVVNLDGTDGIINIFDILKTDESEKVSYIRHISKLTTEYQLLSDCKDTQEIITFEESVRELYLCCGLVNHEDEIDGAKRVTGLPPASYPIITDYVNFLTEKIENMKIAKNSTKAQIDGLELVRLDNIRRNFRRVKNNFGSVLDGHTTIPNIMDEQFVSFNIRNVLNMSGNIADVILFNTLSLCWDNCTRNGMIMKNLYEEKKVSEKDIVHFLIEYDELHKLINAKKTTAIKQLTDMQREMRKYFGGLVLATQSIREMVPKNSKSEDIQLINDLFDLSIYKFIGRQDSNTMGELEDAFGKSLTRSELDRIPKLQQGQFILSMAGDSNLEFKVFADKEELDMFRGGA